MSDIKTTKVRILQDDCEAYGIIEAKNGATTEIDSKLAERMAISGHAEIIKEKVAKEDKK